MKQNKKIYRLDVSKWYITRLVYLVGGVFVLGSVLLAMNVDERWLYFTVFVGFMFMNFAITGYCPMAILIDKLKINCK